MTLRQANAPAGMMRRLGRLFDSQTGVSIIVAMDHGIGGVPGVFHDPRRILEAVLGASPDGVLLNAGLARRCADLLADRTGPSLVLALDHVIHRAQRAEGAAVR